MNKLLVKIPLLVLIILQFSSCKKCGPEHYETHLSENVKGFIPNKANDTLEFIDQLGIKFKMICNTKKLISTGYSSTGHHNDCEDFNLSWDYLQADFTSNLTTDNGEHLSLMQRIKDPGYSYDSVLHKNKDACYLTTGRDPLYFKFVTTTSAQAIIGYIEGKSPSVLKNFDIKSLITLNNKQFQNVFIQSVERPGLETVCPANKNRSVGIDSIYYSFQYGIIRLTTVGGKKYQRIL